ncbi:MAG: class I SAM-dependent methyltransferase [Proteobacteria bacterium]|nr:class I SAM-dependent methyltransferase [Pseudomonadota bacterium]
MDNTDEALKKVFNETVERYSNRYKTLKYDVRTLGWGTKEQQKYRFLQTISGEIDFKSRHILDIGCGFGDYYSFLKNANIDIKSYKGWDLNPDLIGEARNIFALEKNVTFDVKNIFDNHTDEGLLTDIGVMLGVLNFNLKDTFDNYRYSKIAIDKAFSRVREVLIVDFLSSYLTQSYPKEDFVFYHKPELMLEYAFSLSNNAILKHDYLPIPQKEFMLFIFK